MTYKKFLISFAAVVFVLLLSGCADAIQYEYSKDIQKVGFWYGLLHGMIAPVSFVISLFDTKVAVYAVYNNGAWYNLGFLLGVSMPFGGGCSASRRKKKVC